MNDAKNTVIDIANELGWDLDEGMMVAVLTRCAYHAKNAERIYVYPQERVPADAPAYKHPGWLEWIIRIHYRTGGEMTIGCIQRSIGAEYEFHS